MSLAVETTYNRHDGSGTTGPFAYQFKIYEDADLEVVKCDANGVDTALVLNVDYTVTGAGLSAGGTITTTVALALGEGLIIRRAREYLQEQTYTDGARFSATAHNDALDKIVMLVQQVKEVLERVPTFRRAIENSYRNPSLPDPVPTYSLVWNAAGTGFDNHPNTVLSIPIIDYIGNYSSLANAVSVIGASPKYLYINTAITNNDAVTIPATLHLLLPPEGRINGSGSLTFQAGATIIAGAYQVFGTSQTVTGLKDILLDWWGTDAAAITRAFACNVTSYGMIRSQPGNTYDIDATVPCKLQDYTEVVFKGSKFAGDWDDVWFDTNSDVPWVGGQFESGPFPDGGIVRGCKWFGGSYVCETALPTAATCFQSYMHRNFIIKEARLEHFFNGFKYVGKDNYKFHDNWLYDCKRGFFLPGGLIASSVDSTLQVNIIDNQVVKGSTFAADQYGILHEEKVIRLAIKRNAFSGAIAYGIYINDGTYTVQGAKEQRGVVIENNHFEQMAATTVGIYIAKTNGAGTNGATIASNDFTGTVAGFTCIDINKVMGGTIQNNAFRGASASTKGYAIVASADCEEIVTGGNDYENMEQPYISGAIPRKELTVLPEIRTINYVIPEFNSTVGYSTSVIDLDMSTLMTAFGWPNDAPPKGYMISLRAKDSGSSGAACSVYLMPKDGGNVTRGLFVQLKNTENDLPHADAGYVSADANGDLTMGIVASGVDTLFPTVTVTAFVM